jgi:hypothetical protein
MGNKYDDALHIQGQRVSQARYQLGLIFNPKDGGNICL